MFELEFKEIEEKELNNAGAYSAGCSGAQSACCTRVCTKNENTSSDKSTLEEWDRYLELEAGVLQY